MAKQTDALPGEDVAGLWRTLRYVPRKSQPRRKRRTNQRTNKMAKYDSDKSPSNEERARPTQCSTAARAPSFATS
jgi:hypothetical protein